MMTSEVLLEKCHRLADSEPVELNADSLIGFFQTFRPDGAALAGLFDDLDVGDQLHDRLQQLYLAGGDDRRPDGVRDAYFVVRRPPPIDSDLASELAQSWLRRLALLATLVGCSDLSSLLDPLPKIRVLEGKAPKHPKDDSEKSQLLRLLQTDASGLLQSVADSDTAAALRPAYYFVACDAMLRDFLMWPLYHQSLSESHATEIEDPYQAYFQLWVHGVKYRIFGNGQVDLYLPRQTD